ncbi:MAG: 3-phosphoshikimate 1-carboxyvinyltransferase [Rhodothermaceae bacterium]|nr:MAG: 3-phosphoshikimate 1-carboxyvinyltransferase [Rhodothermaceae bacterium]
MNQTVYPAASVLGVVELPADKSVAHRAALLAALADGTSQIVNYPASADPQSTLACLRRLGVRIEEDAEGILHVEGVGLEGLHPPDGPLDCGNSGTTLRLLAGVLAGQPFETTLTGDASLSRRPMDRIATPLRQMGATVELTDGHAPVRLRGGRLRGIEYVLPVPSAQVKSCVLLAGLFAEGTTTVIETLPSRDHTERMLGLDVFEDGAGRRHISIHGGRRIAPRLWAVPRDFSAAAFFLVAGSIAPAGELRLPAVGLNPSRTAFLDVLRAMGADVTVENERTHGGEPLGDLVVRPAPLHGVTVGDPLIPNLIDEIPALAVAAACAEGRTVIRNAAELRVKETDRLAALATNLRALGVAVEEHPDGLVIEGGRPLHGATVESFDDHRIAMAMGVAALRATGPVTITGAGCARISFPGFWSALARIVGH